MWVDFKRIVRSGFIGFWRNAYVSFASIFVMTITLFVIGSAIFMSQLLDASLTSLREKVDVNVYLVTSALEEDVARLKTSLEALSDVAEVNYTSRAEALEQFRLRHENDELTLQALDELGENPLGASLSIRATDPSRYESIAEFLETQQAKESPDAPVIDRINFSQNKVAIDKLTSIIGAVEQTGYVASIILVIVTVLITLNTIRLAIFTTREEISVMRLVGAGNMFIRGPFVFQGVMYGLIAGVLTLLILYPIVLWLGPATETFFGISVFHYYVTEFGTIFLIIVGSGVVLGALSSMLAIARYLKV
ncbi:ABC transporter permease [Candidatus Kaiserbacteria bacterium]|nr:ABC transporter permease [Candidatus Kaiserbacteria bacterium]